MRAESRRISFDGRPRMQRREDMMRRVRLRRRSCGGKPRRQQRGGRKKRKRAGLQRRIFEGQPEMQSG